MMAFIEYIEAKLRISSIKRIILDNTDIEDYQSLDAIKARAIFVLNELKHGGFVRIADFIFKDYPKKQIANRSFLIDHWNDLYNHFVKYSEVLECALKDSFKNKGLTIDNYDQLKGMFIPICEELERAIEAGYVKDFEDIQDFLSIIV